MIRSRFTCLRSGTAAGPLFLIPGLGGRIDELHPFATLLGTDIPIHVHQITGFDPASRGLRIEDIADACVADILDIQPHGEYRLAGYSFGGLVAFEAAKRLLGRGRNVRLLGLIEACPDEGLSSRLLRRKLLTLARTPVGELPAKVSANLRNFSFRLKVRLGIRVLERNAASNHVADKKVMNKVALQRYHPGAAPLDMTFFESEIRLGEFPSDPPRVWRPLVRHLAVERVPGNHHTMIRAHVAPLAAAFTRHLQASLADR